MTQKHTPGLWFFSSFEKIENKDGRLVARICNNATLKGIIENPTQKQKDASAESLANARLIAAASELLEALEECYRVFKMDDVDTAISLRCGMAISKARGGL